MGRIGVLVLDAAILIVDPTYRRAIIGHTLRGDLKHDNFEITALPACARAWWRLWLAGW